MSAEGGHEFLIDKRTTTKHTKSAKLEFEDLSNRAIGCVIEINFKNTRLKDGIKRFVD